MDSNASKALLMAGGVLLSMMVIGLAVATYSHAQDLARSSEESLSASQIESFNRFYTAYRTTYNGPTSLRCIDAVNVLNRAVEDDVAVSESSDFIEKDSDGYYYVNDPMNYTSKNVDYDIEFLDGIGVVTKVTITD